MSKQTNLAYDLSRYEYQTPRQKEVIKAKKIIKPTVSLPKILGLVLFSGVLLCSVLNCKVETARLQSDISKQQETVDILNSENVRMQTEIEGNTSLAKVEDYAENVLGLKKLDKSQIEYVEINTDNDIEIPKTKENIFVVIKNKFYSILEYLRG